MSDAWERCPDCLDMLKRVGVKNTQICGVCTHLFSDKVRCACESEDEKCGKEKGEAR